MPTPHCPPKIRSIDVDVSIASRTRLDEAASRFVFSFRLTPQHIYFYFIRDFPRMAQSMNPSGTPLNLLYINCSPPLDVPEAEWESWLTMKHMPAILFSGAVVRAVLYKETGFAMIPNPSPLLRYMLLYQTDFKRLQDSEQYIKTCEAAGAEKYAIFANNDTRNYKVRWRSCQY